jgi:hypothetical protein
MPSPPQVCCRFPLRSDAFFGQRDKLLQTEQKSDVRYNSRHRRPQAG